MKTHNHKKTNSAHHQPSAADMSFAVGASIAGTALVLLILFSLVLCSMKYSLKNYYRQGLLQINSSYQKQFMDMQSEIQSLRAKIKTMESTIVPDEDAPQPEIVQ